MKIYCYVVIIYERIVIFSLFQKDSEHKMSLKSKISGLKKKWHRLDNKGRRAVEICVVSSILVFISGIILINGPIFYADGNDTWDEGICKVLDKQTQRIRYGHRAIFEVSNFEK